MRMPDYPSEPDRIWHDGGAAFLATGELHSCNKDLLHRTLTAIQRELRSTVDDHNMYSVAQLRESRAFDVANRLADSKFSNYSKDDWWEDLGNSRRQFAFSASAGPQSVEADGLTGLKADSHMNRGMQGPRATFLTPTA